MASGIQPRRPAPSVFHVGVHTGIVSLPAIDAIYVIPKRKAVGDMPHNGDDEGLINLITPDLTPAAGLGGDAKLSDVSGIDDSDFAKGKASEPDQGDGLTLNDTEIGTPEPQFEHDYENVASSPECPHNNDNADGIRPSPFRYSMRDGERLIGAVREPFYSSSRYRLIVTL
jgi:hypothetical protein